MKLIYIKTDLEIYIENQKYDFNINKDIDIDLVRDQFNSTIGKLSKKHNSLEYWLMRLSERNSLVHNLFLDICKIHLLKSLIKKNKDIKIYTNNIAIYLYFSKYANILFKDRFVFESKRFLVVNKPYLQAIKFLLKKFIFSMKYKNNTKVKAIQDTTIIQTWVSDNNFKENNFKDSYYDDLSKYLKNNGKKVITWPVFYNVKDEAKAVEFIRKHNDNFLLIEDYLKVSDYFNAVKHFIKKRFLNLGDVQIDNSDFTSVFKYYQQKESVEMVSLFYSFTKRLKENGSENITFIQHHENMIPEKALILGVRKYLLNSKVIGYFHTTKPRNQLCLEYASDEEYKIAPKPDAIIFNSDKYKKYYEDKYTTIPMYNGIAFKQKHLQNKTMIDETISDKVLVLFSGTIEEIKLMFTLLNVLDNKYKYIFRMHPMNRFNVEKYYKKDNYEIENDMNLDDLINKVSKVISTYSAVAVEMALRGINLGLVYNKKILLLNPFDDTGIQNYRLLSNINELELFLKLDIKNMFTEQIFNIKDEDYKIFTQLEENIK